MHGIVAGDPTEPIDIRYDNTRRRLAITWADGQESVYDYEFLRWRCPCAQCAGELGRPGQLQFLTKLRPEQYELRGLEPVGLYALRPIWEDGHDSGIYTFDRLRALSDEAAADLRAKEQRPPDAAGGSTGPGGLG